MTSFNIDQWLSGEGRCVVEAMALGRWGSQWDLLSQRERDEELELCAEQIRAALSLTTTCGKCEGRGWIVVDRPVVDPDGVREEWTTVTCPNPNCKGGTVPGEPLLVPNRPVGRDVVRDYMRRFNTMAADWVVDEWTDDLIRALRPLEKEDET